MLTIVWVHFVVKQDRINSFSKIESRLLTCLRATLLYVISKLRNKLLLVIKGSWLIFGKLTIFWPGDAFVAKWRFFGRLERCSFFGEMRPFKIWQCLYPKTPLSGFFWTRSKNYFCFFLFRFWPKDCFLNLTSWTFRYKSRCAQNFFVSSRIFHS